MNNLIWVILSSLSPVGELRTGIPVAHIVGFNYLSAYIIVCLVNICVIPITFLFLDYFHNHCMKMRMYEKYFNLYVRRLRRKAELKISHWHYFALLAFIAIPLPGTGAYTSSLVAWIFKLNRKKSFLVISLGVMIAGLIVSLVVMGLFKLF